MATYQMPDEPARRRAAALADVNDALCGARCCAELAGMETHEFVVRELLLAAIQELDRAAAEVHRFYGSA